MGWWARRGAHPGKAIPAISRRLDELFSIPNVRGKLKDPQMRQMLDAVIRKNHEALGSPSTPQWNQWLEESFGQSG